MSLFRPTPSTTLSLEGEQVLRRAVHNIKLDPRSWDQSSFFQTFERTNELGATECGTTACLAGWIVVTEERCTLKEFHDRISLGHLRSIEARALGLLGFEPYSDGADDFSGNIFYATSYKGAGQLEDFLRKLSRYTGIDFDDEEANRVAFEAHS